MSTSLIASASFKLIALARAHRSVLAERLAGVGLHPGPDLLLIELWREDGQTQSQLAERLGVSAPNVTKLVRGLELAGLIARMSDPDDARVVRVHVTPAGARLRRPVERAWREAERTAFAHLPAAEVKQLRRLLSRALGP
jgi:MarR family transcriptional regulator, organic hydroperoxide resistance regulator